MSSSFVLFQCFVRSITASKGINCIRVTIFIQPDFWCQVNGRTCFKVVVNKLRLWFSPMQTVLVLNLIKFHPGHIALLEWPKISISLNWSNLRVTKCQSLSGHDYIKRYYPFGSGNRQTKRRLPNTMLFFSFRKLTHVVLFT